MVAAVLRSLALVLVVMLDPSVGSRPASAQTPHDDTHPRNAAAVTLLQINDVYSMLPVDGVGGLARVAALKHDLAAAGRTPLLLLAGDFLSSSVASTVFKGAQMIDALNSVGLDIATLGNHEFDFGFDVLLQRMAEARFQWVVSNVIDRQTGRPVGGAAPYLVRTFGTLRVGIIGLCLTTEGMPRDRLARIELVDPLDAAATYLPVLRNQQVDVIVALTHLTYAEDRALAERFPEIDLIVGGHEHVPIASTVGRTFISKAGTDARFVARIDLNRRGPRAVERFYELVPITGAVREDPRTAEIIDSWEARLGTEMARPIGRTSVALDGTNTRVRSGETNLGNLIADAMRAEVAADIAMVNSGGIRGDRVYPAGPLSRRTLLEIHPFGNIVCKLAVPGRVVLQALAFGASKLPAAAGQFLQVSGMTYRIDLTAPPESRVRDVNVGGTPLDANKSYTIAVPDYLLQGGDGYTMFDGYAPLVPPDTGRPMVSVLETFIVAQGEVAPAVDGRIAVTR
jgi:5'-nucleotidase